MIKEGPGDCRWLDPVFCQESRIPRGEVEKMKVGEVSEGRRSAAREEGIVKGLDLDGGYHNRLKTVFFSCSAPRVSRRGSGGASREGPGQMTSLPYGV